MILKKVELSDEPPRVPEATESASAGTDRCEVKIRRRHEALGDNTFRALALCYVCPISFLLVYLFFFAAIGRALPGRRVATGRETLSHIFSRLQIFEIALSSVNVRMRPERVYRVTLEKATVFQSEIVMRRK